MEPVDKACRDLFSQYPSLRYDSYTQLWQSKNAVHDVAGWPPPDQPNDTRADDLVKQVNDAWCEAGKERLSDLQCYLPKRNPSTVGDTHFHGNVNAKYLQTGGMANVTQNIGISARDFVTALSVFREAMRESKDPHASEIEIAIQEIATEASAPNGDLKKIGTILTGVAQLVQTSGTLLGAWNALAAVASPIIGHQLPTFPTS